MDREPGVQAVLKAAMRSAGIGVQQLGASPSLLPVLAPQFMGPRMVLPSCGKSPPVGGRTDGGGGREGVAVSDLCGRESG